MNVVNVMQIVHGHPIENALEFEVVLSRADVGFEFSIDELFELD